MLILMGVYNGEKFLRSQLESFGDSGCGRWTLWASDDGSTDGSRELIRDFSRARTPAGCRVVLRDGPRKGFAANYLSMLEKLPEVHGPVALADQDDIWLPKRLGRAMGILNRLPASVPAIVFGRRIDWGPDPARMRPSVLPRGRVCFANALVENVAFGNTIVMNKAAACLAREAAPLAEGIYAHDWWLYQLMTGAGAVCLLDREPSVLYRQHGANSIGVQTGVRQWVGRKVAVMRGVYAQRIDAQLQALERCSGFLTPENRDLLKDFIEAREGPWRQRMSRLREAGIFRQTRQGSIGFWGAVVLGRI